VSPPEHRFSSGVQTLVGSSLGPPTFPIRKAAVRGGPGAASSVAGVRRDEARTSGSVSTVELLCTPLVSPLGQPRGLRQSAVTTTLESRSLLRAPGRFGEPRIQPGSPRHLGSLCLVALRFHCHHHRLDGGRPTPPESPGQWNGEKEETLAGSRPFALQEKLSQDGGEGVNGLQSCHL
jgi:hypothetical protein